MLGFPFVSRLFSLSVVYLQALAPSFSHHRRLSKPVVSIDLDVLPIRLLICPVLVTPRLELTRASVESQWPTVVVGAPGPPVLSQTRDLPPQNGAGVFGPPFHYGQGSREDGPAVGDILTS